MHKFIKNILGKYIKHIDYRLDETESKLRYQEILSLQFLLHRDSEPLILLFYLHFYVNEEHCHYVHLKKKIPYFSLLC